MSKLDFLIRQNQKRREIDNCKIQLNNIFDIQLNEVDFLSLEQTDILTDKFYLSYKNSEKTCHKYSLFDSQKVEDDIKYLYNKFYNRKSYLIIKQTEVCGLIKISTEKALEKYSQIIQLDGDSLCLLTEDESEGIYVDYYEELGEQQPSWFYEICFWKLL